MADAGGVGETLVSVILATNRAGTAPFLRTALDSVLQQTHVAWELLLMDDGSPDPEAARRLESLDPRIRTTRLAPSGVARARNAGVENAHGSLLAFLDDDDVWDRERLARHLALMRSEPEAVVSYCRMRTIDGSGRELAPGDQIAVRDIHDVYRGATGILMPNMLVRRDAFDEAGGFDPSLRVAEDLDLLLRMAMLGPVAFVDGPVLVDYRAHENNVTRGHRDVARSVRSVLERHRSSAVRRGDRALTADLTHRIRANGRYAAWSAGRAARGFLRDRRVGAAAGEVAWAVRFAPGAPVSWLSRRLTKRGR